MSKRKQWKRNLQAAQEQRAEAEQTFQRIRESFGEAPPEPAGYNPRPNRIPNTVEWGPEMARCTVCDWKVEGADARDLAGVHDHDPLLDIERRVEILMRGGMLQPVAARSVYLTDLKWVLDELTQVKKMFARAIAAAGGEVTIEPATLRENFDLAVEDDPATGARTYKTQVHASGQEAS